MIVRKPMMVLVAVLAMLVSLGASHRALAQSEDLYEELLAAAKSSQPDVDYAQLRATFALTDEYQPYGMYLRELRKRTQEAVSENKLELAVARAETMLAAAYPSLETQIWAGLVFSAAGDSARAAFHEDVFTRLYLAATSTGDGSSFDSPITVIYTGEEYLILEALRELEVTDQSIEHVGGHSFDRVGALDLSTGERTNVYFNIDALLATWSRMLDE